MTREKIWLSCAIGLSTAAITWRPAIDALYTGQTTLVVFLISAAILVGLVAATVFLLLSTTRWFLPAAKLAMIALFSRIVFDWIKQFTGSDGLSDSGKLAMVVLALGLGVVLLRRLKSETWSRLAQALTVGVALYCGAPFLYSSSLDFQGRSIATLSIESLGIRGIHNSMVLILDELSPEYAQGVSSALTRHGFQVQEREVAAAGESTTRSIPSMLLNRRHDDAAPCSGEALCGKPSFDFGSLRAAHRAIDVVGFWHPYCSIKGLRYCYRAIENKSVTQDLLGRICPLSGPLSRFFCNPGKDGWPLAWARTEQEFKRAISEAPFWKQGGTLYVHVPIPHPAEVPGNKALNEEYRKNIGAAERLVGDLATKLKTNFDGNVVLIVTSDHPLRSYYWCNNTAYTEVQDSAECMKANPENRERVPLIIATAAGRPVEATMPTTTVGLLAVRAGQSNVPARSPREVTD